MSVKEKNFSFMSVSSHFGRYRLVLFITYFSKLLKKLWFYTK